MIENEKISEYKNRMEAACFTAWQLGAGSGKTYLEYIKGFGLVEDQPKLTEEQKKAISQKAIEKAKRIKAMDQKR